MNIEALYSILDDFAQKGLVFSNEQDFQFEFALALKAQKYIDEVKLEALSLTIDWNTVVATAQEKGKIPRNKKEYTDIVFKTKSGEWIAIELKYKTPDKICCYEVGGNKIVTMAQGAYDFNAYDYLLDISRLENINSRHFCNGKIKISKGYAIMLTNDNHYRDSDFSSSNIWRNYAIKNNETKKGILTFRNGENEYTTKGRIFTAISLEGEYRLKWRDYCLKNSKDSEALEESYSPAFSYLIVEVNPQRGSD